MSEMCHNCQEEWGWKPIIHKVDKILKTESFKKEQLREVLDELIEFENTLEVEQETNEWLQALGCEYCAKDGFDENNYRIKGDHRIGMINDMNMIRSLLENHLGIKSDEEWEQAKKQYRNCKKTLKDKL